MALDQKRRVGLVFSNLMYKSELVPRRWCWLGLIGGPLIIITGTAILFTGNNPSHVIGEVVLIFWLLLRGRRLTPAALAKQSGAGTRRAAAT